jgi:hypothetical protein
MKQIASRYIVFVILTLGLLFVGSTTLASPGAGYTLDWFKIAGGGGAMSNGSFSLVGTLGQAETGILSGGSYTLTGGYASGTQSGYSLYLPLSFR